MTILKWNKAFALEQAADDQELLAELIEIFKTSFAEDVERIRSGVAAAAPGQVAGAAHSIKGASSSLGIDGISELAKRIEDDAKSGSTAVAGQSLPQLAVMLQEVEAL